MLKKILLFLVTITFIVSCKNDNNEEKMELEQPQEVTDHSIEQIFYSLPSPMEVANIISASKLAFDGDYLHSVSMAPEYESEFATAINFGIYAADLSFAIVFNQQNYVTEYYDVVLKMADKLGILESMNDSLLNLIEQNFDDPYRLQQLVSEVFFRSDAYLEDQQRLSTANLILFGGWIETMYLTLSFTHNAGFDDSTNYKILQLIADQTYIIENLKQLIERYNKQDKQMLIADLNTINSKIEKLKTYEQVKIYDEIMDTTITTTRARYDFNTGKLNDLLQTISEIRDKYINLR